MAARARVRPPAGDIFAISINVPAHLRLLSDRHTVYKGCTWQSGGGSRNLSEIKINIRVSAVSIPQSQES